MHTLLTASNVPCTLSELTYAGNLMEAGVSLTKIPKTIPANSRDSRSPCLPVEAACLAKILTWGWRTASEIHRTSLQSLCQPTQYHSHMPHNPAMSLHSSRDWDLTGVVKGMEKRQIDGHLGSLMVKPLRPRSSLSLLSEVEQR